MVQILIFGDSVTYGAWDTEGGWVQRLRRYLDERTLSQPEFWNTDFPQIHNLGVSSNTSTNVLKRFKSETKARLLEGDEKIIFIFDIGTNDSCYLKKENRFVTPQFQFKHNIERLIKGTRKYSDSIFFIGAATVDESRTTPIPWDTNIYYTNGMIEAYNLRVKTVCERLGVRYIDIFEQFSRLNYKELLADGLHPNSAGHEMIFEAIIRANIL